MPSPTKAKKVRYQSEINDEPEDKECFLTPNTYAITINPCDQYQCFESCLRVAKVRGYIFETIQSFHKDISVKLYTEISEPSANEGKWSISNFGGNKLPRVHFHGVIKFHNKEACRYMLEYGMTKLRFCHVNITKFKTKPASWLKYCLKQQDIIDLEPQTLRGIDVDKTKRQLRPDKFIDLYASDHEQSSDEDSIDTGF